MIVELTAIINNFVHLIRQYKIDKRKKKKEAFSLSKSTLSCENSYKVPIETNKFLSNKQESKINQRLTT